MSQRLKRWESPRKEGRNDKGKGGSARQRQKKKQFQMLRKKLKDGINIKQKRDGASVISSLCKASQSDAFLMCNHRNLLSKVCIANFTKISLTENRIFKLVMFELQNIS
jgi:hypothetical protein